MVASWAGALLVTFMACELALRVYQRVTRGIPLDSFLPYSRDAQFQFSPFLVFGPRINWQIPGKEHPELAWFNSQGIRMQGEIGPKPPGEFRIFALGGSTTESVWNALGTHWPLVLECELRARGHDNVRVYNTAMSAYTTAHSLVRLEFDVMDYEPDMVVVMHNINDLTVSYDAAWAGRVVDGHYLVKYGQKGLTGVLDGDDVIVSRFWNFIGIRVGGLFEQPIERIQEYDLEPGRRIFMRNLRWMHAIARAGGSEVLYLTMPFSPERAVVLTDLAQTVDGQVAMATFLPDEERQARDLESFNAAVVEVANGAGARVVDMAGLLGDDPDYFVDLVHYSDAGVERFGRVLANELETSLPPSVSSQPGGDSPPSYCRW